MLKDRRVLLEHEIDMLTKECGADYLRMISNPNWVTDVIKSHYDAKLSKLTNMKTQLTVINDMIAKGEE